MVYFLMIVVIYLVITLCEWLHFLSIRDLGDREDTALECLITAMFWPLVYLLLVVWQPFEWYHAQKYKYDLWRWRVRQEKKRKTK